MGGFKHSKNDIKLNVNHMRSISYIEKNTFFLIMEIQCPIHRQWDKFLRPVIKASGCL